MSTPKRAGGPEAPPASRTAQPCGVPFALAVQRAQWAPARPAAVIARGLTR